MAFERGDIVQVFFDLPHSKETKYHPAIIISNDEVVESQEVFICVMMTSSDKTDVYTYKIEDYMLVSKNNVNFSQARCHLISYVKEEHIKYFKGNHLKKLYVDNLVDRINTVVLTM